LSARASSGSDGASCVAVSDDAARLACYDRAYGRNAASKSAAAAGAAAAGTAAAPKSPAVASPTAVHAAPAAATPKDPVSEFGLTEAAKQAKDPAKAAEAAKAPTSMTAKVISLRFKKYGEFVVTLDNGQVWEQNEPMPSAIVRVGDTVTVKKAVLGSYTLVTAARVATKVHRVD
jgi:FtsP/CotA-like multicopper oxidase with cupredoxin domain